MARTPVAGAPSVSIGGRTFPTIEALGEDSFLALLDTRIETSAIYITLDKDVLRPRGRPAPIGIKALPVSILSRPPLRVF